MVLNREDFPDVEAWAIAFDDLEMSDRVLGKGASGEVISGYWRSTPVAIKRYTKKKYAVHEFSILRLLHHPNIVQILGICEYPDGDCLLVMEHLIGTTLASSLTDRADNVKHKFSHNVVNDISRQLFLALRYLHEHRPERVAHRDIKPSNIFLHTTDRFQNVRVKLIDFGLSIIGQPDEKLPRRVGTSLFMAPELSDKPVTVITGDDMCRADIYALAMVLRILWEQNLVESLKTWRMTPPTVQNLIQNAAHAAPHNRPCPSQMLHVFDHRWRNHAHKFREILLYNLCVIRCNFFETFRSSSI